MEYKVDLSKAKFSNIKVTSLEEWMAEKTPVEVFELCCECPDWFIISKPVQEGDKFVYTITIRQ